MATLQSQFDEALRNIEINDDKLNEPSRRTLKSARCSRMTSSSASGVSTRS